MSKTREELKQAAFELGAMLAQVGDFYDVAEELAKGYASVVAQQDVRPERIVRLELGALNELQSVANSIMAWRVEDARKLYLSWSDIGDVLDVSKQAAQQKYGAKG